MIITDKINILANIYKERQTKYQTDFNSFNRVFVQKKLLKNTEVK